MNLWRHYKGDIYEVLTFDAKNENGCLTVIYKPCYHGAEAPMFTQPRTRWFEQVDHGGVKVDRFTPVNLADLATAPAPQ